MTNDELIQSWFNAIPNEFTITSIVDNGNGTANINTGFTAWALLNFNVSVNDIDYKIIDISRDESITVEGLPIGETFKLDLPFFTYGTPKQVDIERKLKRKNGTFVTPMFYLFAPITESANSSSLSPIEKTLNFTFSVLSNYEKEQFTEDIIESSIKAMRGLTYLFLLVLKNNIAEIDTEEIQSTIKEYPKYAQYFDKGGAKKNIFSEDLSGVESSITLQVKKQNKCQSIPSFKLAYNGGESSGIDKFINFSGRDCLTNEWDLIGVSFIPKGARLKDLDLIGRVDDNVIENIEIQISLENSDNASNTILATVEIFTNEDILNINSNKINLNNYKITENSVVVISRRAVGNLTKTHYWTRNAYLNYKI